MGRSMCHLCGLIEPERNSEPRRPQGERPGIDPYPGPGHGGVPVGVNPSTGLPQYVPQMPSGPTIGGGIGAAAMITMLIRGYFEGEGKPPTVDEPSTLGKKPETVGEDASDIITTLEDHNLREAQESYSE